MKRIVNFSPLPQKKEAAMHMSMLFQQTVHRKGIEQKVGMVKESYKTIHIALEALKETE